MILETWFQKENAVLLISPGLHVFYFVPSAGYCFTLGLNPQLSIVFNC